MTRQKHLSGFPLAPVVTDIRRRASAVMFWRQIAALLLVAALWFVSGLTLSLSVVHAHYAPLAGGLLTATVVFSMGLALWGGREESRPVLIPLQNTTEATRACVKSAAPDDTGTDDDVISLLPVTLFKRSKQLPPAE